MYKKTLTKAWVKLKDPDVSKKDADVVTIVK